MGWWVVGGGWLWTSLAVFGRNIFVSSAVSEVGYSSSSFCGQFVKAIKRNVPSSSRQNKKKEEAQNKTEL